MHYGFIKACAVSPSLRVADCPYNAQMTIEAMQRAAQSGCQLSCSSLCRRRRSMRCTRF